MPRPARVIRIFQIGNQLIDIIIQTLHHRCIVGIVLPLGKDLNPSQRVCVAHQSGIFLQQTFGAHLPGSVHQPSRVIAEKRIRASRGLRQKVQRLDSDRILGNSVVIELVRVGGGVRRKARQTIHAALQAPPVVSTVKALIRRQGKGGIVPVRRHMPLAEHSGKIALIPQSFCEGILLVLQATAVVRRNRLRIDTARFRALAARHGSYIRTAGVFARHDRHPAGRTNRARRVGVGEAQAIDSQLIHVRRLKD